MTQRVAGVDEAGRGPLAGPVVVAAVILDPDRPIDDHLQPVEIPIPPEAAAAKIRVITTGFSKWSIAWFWIVSARAWIFGSSVWPKKSKPRR